MFKLKNLCIIILIILLSFTPSVMADSGSDSFDYSAGATDTWSTGPNTNTASAPPTIIYFTKIEYYDQIQRIEFFYNDTDYSLDADAPPSAFVPFDATLGIDTLGTGVIGYGIGEHGGQEGIWVYLIFYSWDRLSYTGPRSISLDYETGDLYTLSLNKWLDLSTAGLGGDKYVGITQYSGLADRTFMGNPFKITSSVEFHNNYDWSNTTTSIYYLNVTRNITGITYPSKWRIYTSTMEYVNESAYDDTNFSTVFWDAPLYLECEDLYNATYSATIYSAPIGSLNVHGHTINAENNAIISDVLIGVNGYANFSNETGYYIVRGLSENSIYNLTTNKTDYMPYEMNISTSTQNLQIDIPLFKYGLDEYGNYDPSIPYLAGTVKNAGNYSNIKNVVVTLRNNSTIYNAITSTSGLFSIYPDSNGTYTLTAIKPGYYSHESTITISGATSKNIALLPDIEDVEEEEEDYTPGSPIGALYDFFDDLGLSSGWVDAIIALALVAGLGLLFSAASKNSIVPIVGMFFGFVISIALGLLPLYFLTIVIIVVVALLIFNKSGG